MFYMNVEKKIKFTMYRLTVVYANESRCLYLFCGYSRYNFSVELKSS